MVYSLHCKLYWLQCRLSQLFLVSNAADTLACQCTHLRHVHFLSCRAITISDPLSPDHFQSPQAAALHSLPVHRPNSQWQPYLYSARVYPNDRMRHLRVSGGRRRVDDLPMSVCTPRQWCGNRDDRHNVAAHFPTSHLNKRASIALRERYVSLSRAENKLLDSSCRCFTIHINGIYRPNCAPG